MIDKDINPYVDKWEAEKQFPAHEVFKKLGDVGIFGVEREEGIERKTSPLSPSLRNMFAEYGGMGLDFTYSMAVAEALGHINCGGIPMAIAVQADMSTPALAM